GYEAAADDTLQLACQERQQLEGLAVDGTCCGAENLGVHVRRSAALWDKDDFGVVLPVGVADEILDADQVGLDLAQCERGLNDGDARHAGTSWGTVRSVSGAVSMGGPGGGGGAGHTASGWSEPETVRAARK